MENLLRLPVVIRNNRLMQLTLVALTSVLIPTAIRFHLNNLESQSQFSKANSIKGNPRPYAIIPNTQITGTTATTLYLPIIYRSPETFTSYSYYPKCDKNIYFVGSGDSYCDSNGNKTRLNLQKSDTGVVRLKDITSLAKGIIKLTDASIYFRNNPGVLDSLGVINIVIQKADGRVIYGKPVSYQDLNPLDSSLGFPVFNPITGKVDRIHSSSVNGNSSGGIVAQGVENDTYTVNATWNMPALTALDPGDKVLLTIFNDGNESVQNLWFDFTFNSHLSGS